MGIYAVGTGAEDDFAYELNTFNVFNQLTAVANEKSTATYKYNAGGLRLSKTVGDSITTHVWDGSNIVLELDGNGGIIDIYIRGINLIKSDNQGYYVFNAHGDVTARIDNYGTVIKAYHYDAFGNEVNKDDNDTNPFRYCGEYFDVETGSIYLRARYYNPNGGRFLTEDSIRDGLNWYTYCGNNSINFIDSNGLAFVPLISRANAAGYYAWTDEKEGTGGVLRFQSGGIAGALNFFVGDEYGAYINYMGIMMVDGLHLDNFLYQPHGVASFFLQ